ncbi:response regulator transcription factor [Saliterribacillus persicus]|uniref:Two-component system response regulator YesN n=1 Tax=Saliterribacillus persicus TaxID=930114 RepID=A0A368Y3M3_9BACI|nr:response regulator [Saliterribacillus persicus]RCW74782.1 two-component system response regulator YesN [Saliterribacillus persicus]
MYSVFIVDDDVFVRKGIISLIDWEKCGFTVCGQADDGEDALLQIDHLQPDLVITDIRMPVLDGLGLIQGISKTMEKQPYFIIISGYNDFKYAQKALRFGVQDFILKPVDQEELETTLLKVANVIEKDAKIIKNREKMLAITYMKKLLNNEINQEFMKELHIPLFKKDSYTVTKIELNGMGIDYSSLLEVVQQTFVEYDLADNTLFFEEKTGCLVAVFTDMKLKSQSYNQRDFYRKIQLYINAKMKGNLRIYKGKTVSELHKLKESYLTAKTTVQHKYLNENDVLFYEELEKEKIHYIELDRTFYQQLMETIEENNQEKIATVINRILGNCKEHRFAKDAVSTVVNRANHKIIKAIKEAGGDISRIHTWKWMMEWDHYPVNLKDIKQLWLSFLKECAEQLHQLNKNNTQGTIHQIKKFIDANYQQPLTLKSIANKFYMNPVYMGQLFKKTYGIYFKEYLLIARVEEAKILLRQTDDRIYEVAEKVGFVNADYFVTQFEKTVNMTPTQYRKKIANK